MDSFDLALDLDSFPQLSPSDVLTSVFLNDEIDSIDEEWWQELALPSPSRPVEELPSPAPSAADDGTVATEAPSSSSSHTPTTTFNPDVGVAPSSPEAAGSKRSAVSSPETEHDDPKRARRLEKNREAASQSRARKKSYVKELEVKCRMLEAHVAQLQRVMTVTSMENSALKDALVRVKKPKEGVKSGVAEPAVLESNSLPSEFLRHRSCHYPMGQYPTSRTGGLFQGFLLALLQLLMLAAVNGPSDHQTSPSQPLREGILSIPRGMVLCRALERGVATGRIFKRKKGRPRYNSNSGWASRSLEARALGRKRQRMCARLQFLVVMRNLTTLPLGSLLDWCCHPGSDLRCLYLSLRAACGDDKLNCKEYYSSFAAILEIWNEDVGNLAAKVEYQIKAVSHP